MTRCPKVSKTFWHSPGERGLLAHTAILAHTAKKEGRPGMGRPSNTTTRLLGEEAHPPAVHRRKLLLALRVAVGNVEPLLLLDGLGRHEKV